MDRSTRPKIITPSEEPIRVFVSGRIRPDLEPVRDAAESALLALPFVRGWLFEHTPPSSEPVEEDYLRKVAESDFLIWLVDDDYSNPVAAEISAALDGGVPILTFLLPSKGRSPELAALLEKVRERVRTCTVPDRESLGATVVDAIGDELIRRWRGAGAVSRRRSLLAAGLDSRGRMIARMESTGLARERAIAIADWSNPLVDHDPYRPSATEPLRILVGDVGVGKSYIAERCFQDAIRDAVADPTARVPLYVRVGELHVGLSEWVDAHARGLGDPRTFGVFLVLDGADEPGSRSVALLEQARALVSALPDTQVIITTRPLPQFTRAQVTEIRAVVELNDQQTMTLLERVTGEPFTPGHYYGLDPTLRDALHRPLFALIYSTTLTAQNQTLIRSRADLVRALVDHVLRSREDLRPSLEAVAMSTLRSGDAVARRSEVGDFSELQRALNTALLWEEDDGVRFGLAILQEWFAAQYIKQRVDAKETLLASEIERYRLRYSITIALSELPHEQAEDLLEWLVRADPGLAATLVKEVMPNRSLLEAPPLHRKALDYGHELHRAAAAWSAALGRLAPAVLPVDANGRPFTLAVGLSPHQLIYGIARTTEPPVRELRSGEPGIGDFGVRGSATIDDRNGWSWAFVLKDLQRQLRDRLREGSFDGLGCEPYEREMAWQLASDLLGRGSLDPRPIGVAQLETFIAMLTRGSYFRSRGRALVPCDPLLDAIAAARASGRAELAAPWPTPDLDRRGARFVWSDYSPERLLERTRAVYRGAIVIYRHLVATHFAPLAPRLWLFRTLPARLEGLLDPGLPTGLEHGPSLNYRFVPLSLDLADDMRIELGVEPSAWPDPLEEITAEYRRIRPETPWLYPSSTHTVLRIFDPTAASRLAYEWLSGDLDGVAFIEGTSVSPDW